jgi:hypothetical protein
MAEVKGGLWSLVFGPLTSLLNRMVRVPPIGNLGNRFGD